jgi:NDP-sugar pyrophosphorylase family protein
VLTAGLGTRLRPLTRVRAKPAIPVAGVPIVRRILAWLASEGVTDAVLNLHHLPGTITSVVGDGADIGIRVRYSWELPAVLGSAGGPRQALDIVGADTFLIVNGDTMTDVRLGPLAQEHAEHGALVTMAVVPNVRPDHYSGLDVSGDGAVLGVVPRGASRRSFHFIGVQIASRQAFAGVPAGAFANSVGDAYDRLIASRRGAVRAHVCDAQFRDIGTVADYWTTSLEMAGDASLVAVGTSIHPRARVTESITWDDVHVGDGTRLHQCIVTDGVHLASARYTRSILIRGDNGTVIAEPFEADFR